MSVADVQSVDMFGILLALTVASNAPTAPSLVGASPQGLKWPEHPVAAAIGAPAPPSAPDLPSGLASPMPGGYLAGYPVDTGLDLAGIKKPVFSVAAGTVEYAEAGHTAWNAPRDSKYAIRIRLDEPIAFGDRHVTHVWYAHLHSMAFEQPEWERPRRRVEKGQLLGVSGVANGSWHLHLGMLLDGDVSQRWGSYLLEDQVRAVLAGPGAAPLRKGSRLPDFPPARRAVARKK